MNMLLSFKLKLSALRTLLQDSTITYNTIPLTTKLPMLSLDVTMTYRGGGYFRISPSNDIETKDILYFLASYGIRPRISIERIATNKEHVEPTTTIKSRCHIHKLQVPNS